MPKRVIKWQGSVYPVTEEDAMSSPMTQPLVFRVPDGSGTLLWVLTWGEEENGVIPAANIQRVKVVDLKAE
ncbi:MAG: hypothetical protein WC480_04345 [Patescibacteria group bacterium]